MKVLDSKVRGETVRWQDQLFERSIRRRDRLSQLQQLLGSTREQNCLEVTAGDGLLSRQLRRSGGAWTTVGTDSDARDAVQYFVDEEVGSLAGVAIDAPDQSFDAVVLVDALERVVEDRAFIRECHRVLRSDGRLIITTRRKMRFCLGGCPMRGLLGLSWRRKGMARPGYSRHEFFNVLKDGFDVPETMSYSTCCAELPGMICEAIANALAGRAYNMPPASMASAQLGRYSTLCRLAAFACPLLWVSSKLDRLFKSVLPGHNLIVKTKRRVWRERRTPQLIDGRSIAEAALNTKIGTATTF